MSAANRCSRPARFALGPARRVFAAKKRPATWLPTAALYRSLPSTGRFRLRRRAQLRRARTSAPSAALLPAPERRAAVHRALLRRLLLGQADFPPFFVCLSHPLPVPCLLGIPFHLPPFVFYHQNGACSVKMRNRQILLRSKYFNPPVFEQMARTFPNFAEYQMYWATNHSKKIFF